MSGISYVWIYLEESVHSRIQNPVRHARCVKWNFLGRYLMAGSQKLYFCQKLHLRCLTGLNECLTGSAVADFMVFLYLTLNTFNTAFNTFGLPLYLWWKKFFVRKIFIRKLASETQKASENLLKMSENIYPKIPKLQFL